MRALIGKANITWATFAANCFDLERTDPGSLQARFRVAFLKAGLTY